MKNGTQHDNINILIDERILDQKKREKANRTWNRKPERCQPYSINYFAKILTHFVPQLRYSLELATFTLVPKLKKLLQGHC